MQTKKIFNLKKYRLAQGITPVQSYGRNDSIQNIEGLVPTQLKKKKKSYRR
jgi:hypothetical protein